MYQRTTMTSEPRPQAQIQFGRHAANVVEPKIFARTVLTCLKISCVLGKYQITGSAKTKRNACSGCLLSSSNPTPCQPMRPATTSKALCVDADRKNTWAIKTARNVSPTDTAGRAMTRDSNDPSRRKISQAGLQ